jgi:hypothetical protein
VDPEGLIDQHGVFIDLLSIDLDETLADGLDETDAADPFSKGGEKAEGAGGLTVVLLRRGDKEARSNLVHFDRTEDRCGRSGGASQGSG